MAEEVVAATQTFTWTFYVLIFLVIVAILLIVFFIRRLKYKRDQVLKSIAVSLFITLVVELAYLIVGLIFGFFTAMCFLAEGCSTVLQKFLSTVTYSGPVIFLVSLLIYYIVKYFKK
jgi:hypothetical protein